MVHTPLAVVHFNTSYVVIKLNPPVFRGGIRLISIHLMLLLNILAKYATPQAQTFQYILCCY